MKIKITLLLLLTLSLNFIFAQAPQKISYQAVIRNIDGQLLTDNNVGMKISILKGSVSGNEVFEETHHGKTNINGLVSIEIGTGNIISGNFALIDWSSGSYYIKTETDPSGGSNYTITGTSQLLSVPYALYAENTKNPGKTNIYITDDITDEEASLQIAEEIGPNTENLYIQNTTSLTTLNLVLPKKLGNIYILNNKVLKSVICTGSSVIENIFIESNPNLETLNLSDIKKVTNTLNIRDNTNLTSIYFSPITNNIQIYGNNMLTEINLNNLKKADNFIVEVNNKLSSINLNQLTDIKSLLLFSNPMLTTINLGSLKSISEKLLIYSNSTLTSINIPQLTNSKDIDIIYNEAVSNISIENLKSFTGKFEINDNPKLNTIKLSNLEKVPNGNDPLSIHDNAQLTEIILPNLISGNIRISTNQQLSNLNLPSLVYGYLRIDYNAQLTSISLPSFNNGTLFLRGNSLSSMSFPKLVGLSSNPQDFSYNKLPSAAINYFLHQLLSTVLPTGTIYLNHQVPSAPPTGQGTVDKQTLINSGTQVITD